MLSLKIIPKWLDLKLKAKDITLDRLDNLEFIRSILSPIDFDIYVYIQNNKSAFLDPNIVASFDECITDATGKESLTIDMIKKDLSELDALQQIMGMDSSWDGKSYCLCDKGYNTIYAYPCEVSTIYSDALDIYGVRFDVPKLTTMPFWSKWLKQANITQLGY